MAEEVAASVTAAEGSGSITVDSTEDEVRAAVKCLATEYVRLHRRVAERVRCAYSCKNGNRMITDWICANCATAAGRNYRIVVLKNCVLGRFVRDVFRYGSQNPYLERHKCNLMSIIVEQRPDQFEKYLSAVARRLPPTAITYWKKCGVICPDTLRSHDDSEAPESDSLSLFTFSGRHRCRVGIDFEKVDK